MLTSSLVSAQNRVESPFIIVTMGNYTFGNCSDMESLQRMRRSFKVTYPNFMKSIRIVKVNGTVNTYTIVMEYAITEFDDPNLIDKILSSISKSREIKISYGDWNAPAYIYKDEVAIISKISSNVDMSASKITYTISCTSTALSLKAGSFSFNACERKPSDVIKELLNNEAYGLKNIFTGMKNSTKVSLNNFIAGDDKVVRIDAKQSINILDYLGYLVNCMESQTHNGGNIKDANYFMAVYDDISNEYGGPYFKIVKVATGQTLPLSYSTYEVDVGYPSGSYVSSFTVDTDNAWSILYDYAQGVQQPQRSYSIDDNGQLISSVSPVLMNSSKHLKTTATDKTWWTQVTQFPITATITIKGLLRPALLMSSVKVNTFFYGRKHMSSGLYLITRQEDSIDANGYKTTLRLLRTGGDANG